MSFWLSLRRAARTRAERKRRSIRTSPVTVGVPFAPGGLTDVPARLSAIMLQEKIGQNIVVENQTGGSGVVGATSVVARNAGRLHAARQFARRHAEHALSADHLTSGRRFPAMIGWIVDGPALVLLDRRQPAAQDARRADRRRQGQSEQVQRRYFRAGLVTRAVADADQPCRQDRDRPVPYRGSGEAARAVVGRRRSRARSRSSHKPSRWSTTASCARSQSPAPKRIDGWPDVPTFVEQGYNIVSRGFVGLAAPAKTPKPVISVSAQASQRRWCKRTRSSSSWPSSA